MSKNGIVELIKEIGNDNISFQMLSASMTNISQKKNDVEVTFATNEITPNDAAMTSGKVGIVVWVDNDAFTNALETTKD